MVAVGEVEKEAVGQKVVVGLCESVPVRDVLRHTVGDWVREFVNVCVMESVGVISPVALTVNVGGVEKVAEGQ